MMLWEDYMNNQNKQIDQLHEDYVFIEETLEFHKQQCNVKEKRIEIIREKIDKMIAQKTKNIRHDAMEIINKYLYDSFYKDGKYDKYG